MAEQHSLTADYETPYKFNGKELDSETGLYYYGARYYDPRASIWLSTDPLMEMYPNVNPYTYCLQNPIVFIDPDGKDGVRIVDKTNKTITIKAVYYVQTKESVYFTKSGKINTLEGYTSKDVQDMQTKNNEYLNGLSLMVSEGEYKDYTIKFDLQFKDGGSVTESEELASKETYK